MDHSKHVHLAPAELTANTLDGATIYGPGDEKIGSVSHIHGAGPSIQVVIDVGGFLGIGAKPVSVPMDQLEFMRDEDGGVHAVTTWTKDELKAMPEHLDPCSELTRHATRLGPLARSRAFSFGCCSPFPGTINWRLQCGAAPGPPHRLPAAGRLGAYSFPLSAASGSPRGCRALFAFPRTPA